jgi:hypothetical protein
MSDDAAARHLTSLKHRHRELDGQIREAERFRRLDHLEIRSLKRQKLALKDAIVSLEAQR